MKCPTGKNAHETKDAARIEKARLDRLRNGRLNVYQCAFGPHYHVGHEPAGLRQAKRDRRRARRKHG